MFALMMATLLVTAQGQQAQEADTPAASEPAAGDRIICRYDNAIGSRAKKKRICMTARDWERTGAATREGVNDLVARSRLNPAVDPVTGGN